MTAVSGHSCDPYTKGRLNMTLEFQKAEENNSCVVDEEE